MSKHSDLVVSQGALDSIGVVAEVIFLFPLRSASVIAIAIVIDLSPNGRVEKSLAELGRSSVAEMSFVKD